MRYDNIVVVMRQKKKKKRTLIVIVIQLVLVAGDCGLLSALTQNQKQQSRAASRRQLRHSD